MRNSFLLLMLFVSTQASAKSVVDYLTHPHKFNPGAQTCVLEDDQDEMSKCIKDLCQDVDPDLFPMSIEEDKFESFIASQPIKISPAQEKKNEDDFNWIQKSLNDNIDRLLAKTPDEIIAATSKKDKGSMVTSRFLRSCEIVVSPEKVIQERVDLNCEDKFYNEHPLKKQIIQNLTKAFEDDIDTGLSQGFFSLSEVSAKIPELESHLQQSYQKLKVSKQMGQQDKEMLAAMDKNWGKFSTLDYTSRMKYLKALSLLKKKVEIVEEKKEYYSNLCRSPDCEKMFNDLIIKKGPQEKLAATKVKINDPEFKNRAMALMKIQSSLINNKPSAVEIRSFYKTKEKVIEKILAFQKEKMSEHSFGVYKEKLDEASVTFDEALVSEMEDIEKVDKHYDQDALINLAYGDEDVLFSTMGANQAPPFFLVTDYYLDPKYKDFSDENFETTEVKFSLFSLKEKAYGSQILAHELGHHFSHLHQAEDFSVKTMEYVTEAKACVRSRYDKFQSSTGKDAGNYYLEEEFADEFTTSIDSQDAKLTFCPFLIKADMDTLNLTPMASADTHPEDLWRTLNLASSTGKTIPPVCKDLMTKYADKYEYKKCL